MTRLRLIAACMLIGTFGFVGPTMAQSLPSQGDVSFSYAFLKVRGEEDHIKTGWNISFAPRGNRFVSAVIDGGGHYVEGFSLHTAQAGVRVGRPMGGKLNPFAQFTAGVGFAHEGDDSLFVLILQPGGGFDVPFSPSAALRTQVDLPFMIGPNEGFDKFFRLTVGVVLQLKQR